jgi:hypothetical protein
VNKKELLELIRKLNKRLQKRGLYPELHYRFDFLVEPRIVVEGISNLAKAIRYLGQPDYIDGEKAIWRLIRA